MQCHRRLCTVCSLRIKITSKHKHYIKLHKQYLRPISIHEFVFSVSASHRVSCIAIAVVSSANITGEMSTNSRPELVESNSVGVHNAPAAHTQERRPYKTRHDL